MLLLLEPEQTFCTRAEAVPKRAKPEGLAGKLWNVALGLPFLRECPFLTPERGRVCAWPGALRQLPQAQGVQHGRTRSGSTDKDGRKTEVRGLWERKPVSSLSSLSVFPLTVSPFLLSLQTPSSLRAVFPGDRERQLPSPVKEMRV